MTAASTNPPAALVSHNYSTGTVHAKVSSGGIANETVLTVTNAATGCGTTGTASGTPAWAHLSPATSPQGRSVAAMACDLATGQLVLFGGAGNGSTLNDTWVWNGTTWTQVDDTPVGCTTTCTNSPPGRHEASMTYDAANHGLLLFGGIDKNGNQLNDTWEWNGTTWTQVDDSSDPGCGLPTNPCPLPTSPPARYDFSMASDPNATHDVVMFGGAYQFYQNDTWVWNGTTWTKVDNTPVGCTISCVNSPPARENASMAYDPASSDVVLFGGLAAATTSSPYLLNDTWEWNGSTTTWTQVDDTPIGCGTPTNPCTGSVPSARRYASMAYGGLNDMVLFGGSDNTSNTQNDTWVWSE
jgi:hypothetical protein